MPKKLNSYSLIFFILCAAAFIASLILNRSYFHELAYANVAVYQLKQVFSILLLFMLGYFLLHALRDNLSALNILLYAFPTGICIWVFISFFILLAGIPYTMTSVLAAAALIIFLLSFIRLRRQPSFLADLRSSTAELFPALFLTLGFILLVSTGFIYVFISYDSYFYFTNYGHTLSIVKSFADIVGDNSFTLTNISQFLPLLNAYTSFWGLDQCFQMQAFLTVNVSACFFHSLYSFACTKATKKRALVYSALFTLLLVSSTSFIIISSWVLANMYCMAYIFLLFILSFHILENGFQGKDYFFLLSLFLTALTLMRKDGIVFAAFFLICFCTKSLFSAKKLSLIFLPAAAVELLWLFYVRIVLDAGVTQAAYSSIANNKNITFVFLIIAGSFSYIFLFHPLFRRLEEKCFLLPEYAVLLAGMTVLLYYSFTVKSEIIIDNVDMTIRNMFRYPSSWGISALIFGVLLALSLVRKLAMDYYHFVWFGYSYLNFISYCIVDNKSLWVNWDDSYNRVLLQIVPVFVFIMGIKILDLLQSCTPDRSSESLTGGGQ